MNDLPESQREENKPEVVNLKLSFRIPEFLPSRYAHHLIAQTTETEVVLMFFEVQTPILTGTDEEQIAQLQALGGVNAYCVSKISVPKAGFPAMASLMNATAQGLSSGEGPIAAVKAKL